ncbi:MAG: hypothetical protein Q4G14_11290 [Paracoccus sp. (in: a-proteobacteria)]|uniref:hypothetical protein n=1 Tax=Paracoccus sp. TaxID=267 RepID=UPI0026DEBBB5|nr:hypothetical protein [Paracoccus sp. (in: a-proteobacteria)]MDO5613807.1 hypothetical protein [Paracoccus sp. (in: a-proteobacteria)]
MNVTSAQVALTLMTSGSTLPVSVARPESHGTAIDAPAFRFGKAEPSNDLGDFYVPDGWDVDVWKEHLKQVEEYKVAFEASSEWMRALRRGEVGPFDEEPEEARTGVSSGQVVSDPRFKFEGYSMFMSVDYTPRMGQQVAQTDVPYTDRRDAMVVAYHFGKKLSQYSRDVAQNMPPPGDARYAPSGQLIGVSKSGVILPDFEASKLARDAGNSELLRSAKMMEEVGATLAGMFSFASAEVTNAAYKGEAAGFSISLTGFGKLIDVDSRGRMTLYDADGAAYSPQEYNEQDIGGGIPELYNEEIRNNDRKILREQGVGVYAVWNVLEQAAERAATARGALV